ncbi:MAG: hypothetical protein E6Q85_00115 [Thiothrix sp.]|nr:MAG: hypothetical protein E6Q85_00115 [Thiothrix sp.]
MNPTVFHLQQIGAGNLYIMPCPRPHALAEDMTFYMDLGVHTIICLLEKTEMIVRGLALEAYLCDQLNLEFKHFPIVDRSIPNDLEHFHRFIESLYAELQQGRNLAIHCYAGIGRTGVVAGSLLIRDGCTPQDAIELMTRVRGYEMPQTPSQYNFLLKQPTRIVRNSLHTCTSTERPWWQRLISWSPAA